MNDEYHMDLRQEDDRANADLHGEFETATYGALRKIGAINSRLHIITRNEWSALCFAAGYSPYQFPDS